MAKYFKKSEFCCNPKLCGCGFCDPDPRLMETLDIIREALGKPITVTSGCRCTLRNKQVGGVTGKTTMPTKGARGGPSDSYHTHGTAADITANGVSAEILYQTVRRLYDAGKLKHLKGLGRYDTFVHVDVSDYRKAFTYFDYRKKK